MSKKTHLIVKVFQDNDNVKISYEATEEMPLIDLIEMLSVSFKELYSFAQEHPSATFSEAMDQLKKGVAA